MRRRACALVAAILAAAGADPARAGDGGSGKAVDAEAIDLEYHAPQGCPDQGTFEARVTQRTSLARFVGADEKHEKRTFEVWMDAGPAPSGSLIVRRAGAIEGSREVRAGTCDELADALVLVVALAIDPGAAVGPLPIANASPPAAANVPPEGTAPEAAVASSAPPATAAPVTPVSRASPPAPAPPALPGHTPKTLALGAGGAIATAAAPRTLAGVEPFIEWSSAGVPTIRLRASLFNGSTAAVGLAGAAASFAWTVARVDGCVGAWPPGPAHLLACARLEGGGLEVTGASIVDAKSQLRPWVAAGPLVRAEWQFLGVFFLDADAAAMIRAKDDRFYFYPDVTAYTVPPVGLEASAGLGVHFL